MLGVNSNLSCYCSQIIGKHRDLQRITIPYANLLGVMDKESNGNESMDL